jgi:hypothetical protein
MSGNRRGISFSSSNRRVSPVMFPPVEKVRVGEDRDPREAEDHCRRSDKENRDLRQVGRGHVGARQGQFIDGFHFRSLLSVLSSV